MAIRSGKLARNMSRYMSEVLSLDGGILEGGGQILRNSVAYSALLHKPIQIFNIRANRDRPGLRPQHLAGIQLVRDLCNGRVLDGKVSSQCISFFPAQRTPAGSTFTADPGTAGSITLLIQVSLPVLLFAPPALSSSTSTTVVNLRGGTNATSAPQVDYITHIFEPMARKLFGIRGLGIEIEKRGYYPRGGGMVTLRVEPIAPGVALTPAVLEDRGEVVRIHGFVFVAGNLPIEVATKMRKAALKILRTEGYDRIATLEEDIKAEKIQDGVGTASGIILWAETSTGCIIAGSALGEKRISTTQTAIDATQGLLNNLSHNGCVDEYLQDQIIIFMALAEGKSRVVTGPLTLHTLTAINVAQELTEAKFEVKHLGESRYAIECDGVGFKVPE